MNDAVDQAVVQPLPEATRKSIRNTAFIVVGLILLMVVGFVWKISQPRALSVKDMAANGLILFDKPREVLPFELQNHLGEPLTRDALVGKWTLIFPGFTHCPDICPTTMSQLNQMWGFLDEAPRADLQVMMLSVDPFRDTPEILAQYVPFFNQEFIGVTGNLAVIAALATQLNIAFDIVNPETAPEEYSVDHSSNIALINPEGNYQGFFKAPFDPALLRLNYQSVWIQNR